MITKLVYDLSPDVIEHKREVYSILDLIGDTGGFFDGIQYIFKFLIFMLSLFSEN